MATQLYVMPITGTGTDTDSRRPKYADTDLAGTSWAAMDFGNEPFMLVATPTNATLAGHADVHTLPLNLDTTLTAGAVTTVTTKLEAAHIPAQWVAVGMTYRQVVKTICQMFMFWQRCQGLGHPQLFTGGVTQDSAFSSLPQEPELFYRMPQAASK